MIILRRGLSLECSRFALPLLSTESKSKAVVGLFDAAQLASTKFHVLENFRSGGGFAFDLPSSHIGV